MIPRDVYVNLGFANGTEFEAFFAAENKANGTGRNEMIIRADLIRRAVDGEKLDMRSELVRLRKTLEEPNVKLFPR